MNTITAIHKYNVYYYLPNGEVVLDAFNQSYYDAKDIANAIGGFIVRADKEQPTNA